MHAQRAKYGNFFKTAAPPLVTKVGMNLWFLQTSCNFYTAHHTGLACNIFYLNLLLTFKTWELTLQFESIWLKEFFQKKKKFPKSCSPWNIMFPHCSHKAW